MNIQATKSELFKLIQGIQDIERLNWLKRILEQIENKTLNVLTKEETKYLLKINEGIPDEILTRFEILRTKKKNNTITPEEDLEIKKLITTIELAEGDRLENMVALAKLWNMTLDELREKLQIYPPQPHG